MGMLQLDLGSTVVDGNIYSAIEAEFYRLYRLLLLLHFCGLRNILSMGQVHFSRHFLAARAASIAVRSSVELYCLPSITKVGVP